jgi:hypothetical protein
MNDEIFLAALEEGTLPAAAFDHSAHVRAAYLYLRGLGFLPGMAAFRSALRAFAQRHGALDKYNETMTMAFLVLIHERMADGTARDWVEFAAANPDLFDRKLLYRYYRPSTLQSERAKRIFILDEPERHHPA